MALWKNEPNANSAPKWKTDIKTGETGVEEFGEDIFYNDGKSGIPASVGWVRRVVGTGGRAGRVTYEPLVALNPSPVPAIEWYEETQYADYAIVLDYENNRYAMPALDDQGEPILERDENGVYPKREVTFADAMRVDRYEIQPSDYVGDYASNFWYTYQNNEWSLIGGDGIGTNVPRLENWTGRTAMWVDTALRFNRMPHSLTASYPQDVTLLRSFNPGYRVSWVGDDDLVYSVEGHPEAPWSGVIEARSTTADGLNWGEIPYIPSGYAGEVTTISRANKPGSTFFDYVNMDTWTNHFLPATSMVVTDGFADVNNNYHVERSPEHVRVSPDITSILGRGDGYPRAGTYVLETQQTQAPDSGGYARKILGASTDASAMYGRAFLAYTEDAGVYRLTSQSPFGDLHLPLASVDVTTSTVRMAIAFNGNNNLRRLAITGADAVEDTGNPGFLAAPHFGMPTPATYTAPESAAREAGVGAYYKFMWSPETFTSEKIVEEVTI